MFETISTSKIIGLVDGNVLSLCPTMDLIVLSMNRMSIWVFRLNGERIYSINNKSIILDLTWSPDGKYFCLSGVDGFCKVYDTNNGDVINQFQFNKPIELINWCQDLIANRMVNMEAVNANSTIDGSVNQGSNKEMDQHPNHTKSQTKHQSISVNTDKSGNKPDEDSKLEPDELFAVNILESLPKTNDFIDFQDLNYMVVSSCDQISIVFNNLVKIGCDKPMKFIKNFNDDLFNQYYITQLEPPQSENNHNYKLVKLTIANTENLTRVLLIFCKIKLLLIGIKKNIESLSSELVSFFNVFDRYLSNYYDNLNPLTSPDDTTATTTGTSQHESITKSLTGMLITHLIPNSLTDYWLNQFGERAYKRLDKLGNTNYDLIRNLIYRNLIVSLEKLLLLLTDLRSIIEFNSLSRSDNPIKSFNINESDLTESIDEIKAFIKRLFNFIWDCNEEQKLFNQFLRWTKFLIDTLTRYNNDDDINIGHKFDYVQLINYFRSNLLQSKIFNYLNLPLNTEVLCTDPLTNKEPSEPDLNSQFDQNIEGKIFNNIFVKFESYFNSIMSFTDLTSFNITDDCEFISVNDKKLIVTIDKSLIKIIQLNGNYQLTERVIDLQKPIVNYKIFNDNFIALVNFQDSYYLEGYKIGELLISKGNETNEYHPQHQSKLSHIPKYLFINDQKNYGCLLDSNKKDYSIFQL